jgi:hypothetical protein
MFVGVVALVEEVGVVLEAEGQHLLDGLVVRDMLLLL